MREDVTMNRKGSVSSLQPPNGKKVAQRVDFSQKRAVEAGWR
jgi:hypothetical protein